MPRPRTALLPGPHRRQRGLQPHLPRLLLRLLAAAGAAPAARRDRADDGHARAQRGGARPAAAFRRRTDDPPGDSRDHRRGQAAAHPSRDAQHKRHPHRRGSGVRPPTGRVPPRFRGLPAVRLAAAGGAPEPARRRPDADPPAGPRAPGAGRRLHDAGRRRQAGSQRRRDPGDHRACARVAVRPRRRPPADPGRRPQRGL